MENDFLARCGYTLFSVPFLLFGLYGFRLARRFDRVGVRALGTVVAYETGEPPLCPIVEYVDKSGVQHRVTLWSPDKDSPAVGAAMDIVYDPEDPQCANGISSWILRLSSGFFVACAVISTVLIWLGKPNGSP
jgi:hypothetical protein